MTEGDCEMEELEQLQQVLSQRMERIHADEEGGKSPLPRRTLQERRTEPSIAEAIEKVHLLLQDVPDIRKDRVQSIKKELALGLLPLDGKTLADRILQRALLNELS